MPTIANLTHAAISPTAADAGVDRARRRESGYSLVELLVVLLILGILLGMIISTFRGPKRAVYYKSAISATFLYADAVEAYMADNGQRAPSMLDTSWARHAKYGYDRGPQDLMLVNTFYMRQVPELVQDGAIDLVPQGQAPNKDSQFKIEYSATPATGQYTFRVSPVVPEKDSKQLTCVVTNRPATTQGERRC